MYRELYEEVGLRPEHVAVLGRTKDWLRYDVPIHWIKREWRGSYRGQKQIWFLLRLVGRDSDAFPCARRIIRNSMPGAGAPIGCPLMP